MIHKFHQTILPHKIGSFHNQSIGPRAGYNFKQFPIVWPESSSPRAANWPQMFDGRSAPAAPGNPLLVEGPPSIIHLEAKHKVAIFAVKIAEIVDDRWMIEFPENANLANWVVSIFSSQRGEK